MTQAQLDLQKQAQLDLQTQLEQATPTDLITRPLLNDSPVLYIESSEQTPPTFLEQMEHTKVQHENSKPTSSQDDNDPTQTPPPPKKRYEIIEDPIFLSSPIYPPSIPSKVSLCTNRDDHLIPLFSTDNFIFKAQLTSICILLIIHFAYMTKIKIFSHQLPPKSWVHTNIGLITESKFSLYISIFSVLLSTISKQMNQIHLSFRFDKKLLIIKRILNFYNTRNHKITFLSITNIHHRSQ